MRVSSGGEYVMVGRIFVDPERGEKWESREIHTGGRHRLVFKGKAVWLWAGEVPTSDVDAISDDDLRKAWRTSWREIWCAEDTWCVRWEEQPDLQTWTRFESASGQKRFVKAQIMFPFLSWSQLADQLGQAERSK
jgi:hypothetical protein